VSAESDFDRLTAGFIRRPEVSRGRMFGWSGLKAGRRFFALTIEDRLIVKLPAAEVEALVNEGTATQFDPGWGRVKKLWADVGPEQTSVWTELVERAYQNIVSLEGRP